MNERQKLKLIIFYFFSFFLICTAKASQTDFHNTPPVVLVDNHWKINESEKVGTVIARVQASDADPNDVLTFGLDFDELTRKENETLPFRINQDTGVVYLNESLDGRGGDQFLLYVTVTDGTYNAKNGVMVNVIPKNSRPNGNGAPFRPPFKNATHLLPPFASLPGVPPPPPLFTARPPYYPPRTEAYPDPDPASSSGHNDSGANNSTDQQHKSNDTPKPNGNGTTATNEMPFNVDGNENTSNETQMADGDMLNGTNSTSETTIFPRSTLKTVLPIAIIACGIIIASGLIVSSFLFRKRLCAIGKSLKNKSKEEMAKKSNQSNLSCSTNTVMMSSISEDSRNSMVMQHWNGPTAFSNRYVPWERENSHMQVNIELILTLAITQPNTRQTPSHKHILRRITFT